MPHGCHVFFDVTKIKMRINTCGSFCVCQIFRCIVCDVLHSWRNNEIIRSLWLAVCAVECCLCTNAELLWRGVYTLHPVVQPVVEQAVWTTGAVPAMKPEGTSQNSRWKITLTFDERRSPNFRHSMLEQTTHRWWSLTSCFGVTNHSKAASLWLVRQD